jgi:hypothetical protein
MKTIYIDHNVIAREDDWPKLSQLVTTPSKLRLVVSDWNLFEIMNGDDKAQAIRRAEFLCGKLSFYPVDARSFYSYSLSLCILNDF